MTDTPIFFITTDPLKALGVETLYPNFHITCVDYTPLVDILTSRGISIFCFERDVAEINSLPRNTRKLLMQPETQQFILENSIDTINLVMFKPNFSAAQVLRDSQLSKRRSINVLNNAPGLTSKLEDKLEFHALCLAHDIPFPKTIIENLHSLSFDNIAKTLGIPFVIQFARGWFGNHTFFIFNEEELKHLIEQYTDRDVKVASFIKGVTLTNNAVVTKDAIYQTYPFLQITDDTKDIESLARLPGSSIGNAWISGKELPVPNTHSVVEQINRLTNQLGSLIRSKGYKGFFGLDFLVDKEGNVYAQELNARFTASAFLMAQMEQEACGANLVSKHFEAMGLEFFKDSTEPEALFTPLQGARIVARHTDTKPVIVKNIPLNGLYSYDGKQYTFISKEYRYEKLRENEFLLFTTAKGREVTVDQELAQLISRTIPADELMKIARKVKTDLIGNS